MNIKRVKTINGNVNSEFSDYFNITKKNYRGWEVGRKEITSVCNGGLIKYKIEKEILTMKELMNL